MAILTISRTYGCGGREIARELASILGYHFFEKEIIPTMAQKLDRSLEAAQKHELTIELPLTSAVDIASFRIAALQKNSITPREYVEALRTLFFEMVHRGNAIIIGRGSQFVLQNEPGVYHLRLVANLKDRMEHLRTEHLLRLLETDMVQKVQREERHRREFLETHFQSDGEDPLLYHLTINLSKISRQKAIDLIVNLVT
ncbi:MAG: cytidylate kinase-like family protein [bacterium]